MQQSLQKNTTMIEQLNYHLSPHPPQPQSLSYQFKTQHPPFQKWDGTPTTTPLFLAQIATHKSKAFYVGVKNWTQRTQTNRHISVSISSDIPDSLPSSIPLMFLNDARFTSDRIAILFSLLNHLNPSSNENVLLAISDLIHFEMRLG